MTADQAYPNHLLSKVGFSFCLQTLPGPESRLTPFLQFFADPLLNYLATKPAKSHLA